MFPSRFFPDRFFPPRFFPPIGSDVEIPGIKIAIKLKDPIPGVALGTEINTFTLQKSVVLSEGC